MTREMKDSGIEWIGEMPRDWKVSQVKHLFEIGRGRVISKEELSYTEENGYPVYSSQTKNDGILGYIGTYDFTDNMLTWTTDGANAGTIFKRTGKYSCTNVCGTLRVKDNLIESIDLNYAYYALYIGAPYYKRKDTNGFKIMNNEMAIIKFPFPDLKKQQKIVNILDTKVNSIEKIIRKTHLSIVELKKYKQSLITEAVTKGLNPNVEMKDSGIEWIGKIPKHWEVFSPFRVLKVIRGNTSFKKDDMKSSGDYVAVQYGQIYQLKEVTDEYAKYIDAEFYKEDQEVLYGDTILISTSETIEDLGHTCYYNRIDTGLLGGEQLLLRPKNGYIHHKFLYYASTYFQNELKQYATGIKVYRFNVGDLKKIRMVVPPIEEQKEITKKLEKKIMIIEQLIENKQQVIQELESYKKSLIYEYVTGKKEA